jgi:rare lipoprotein A
VFLVQGRRSKEAGPDRLCCNKWMVSTMTNFQVWIWIAAVACFLYASGPAAAAQASLTQNVRKAPVPSLLPRKRRGKASVYSRKFSHKRMADGTRLDLESNAAASRLLPLGTKAKVTNLRNGRSAVVEIKDRGPYVKGRIIDLSPRTAATLHFGSRGIVPVEVAPIEEPLVSKDSALSRDNK